MFDELYVYSMPLYVYSGTPLNGHPSTAVMTILFAENVLLIPYSINHNVVLLMNFMH